MIEHATKSLTHDQEKPRIYMLLGYWRVRFPMPKRNCTIIPFQDVRDRWIEAHSFCNHLNNKARQ